MQQNFFVGVVENRTGDPLKLGRIQVRVFGVHSESLEDIPTASLPWAIPLMPATSASLSGIGHSVTQYIEGTSVILFFIDGESKQQPIIMGSYHGIPLSQSPFVASSAEGDTVPSVTDRSVNSTVKASSSTASVDTAGTPVETPAGEPVVAATPGIVPPVDISKMVAKFGANVTLVYKTLLDFGIKEPNAIVAILSNVAKECQFKPRREGMMYSSASRLKEIFPTKFVNMADAQIATYINNEQKLANLVYANRYGNGSTESGDGFAYRGGGFIQLTFKSNYVAVGSKIGIDFIASPEKINDASIAAKAVAQFFVNAYGGAGRITFSSLESALIAITKKVNAGGFANDFPKVKSYSVLCKVISDPAAAEEKEAEAVAEKPNNPENDVNKNATKAQIDAGIVAGKHVSAATANIGFADPNKKYPLNTFLKEPDSNRLSRRSTALTYVKSRLAKRRSGMRSIGATFNEPAPAYNGRYPFNHVYASESGHVQEFDDTPGSERINTYHNSGTFQEIDKYGNRINKIIGDDYTIIERNGYIYIDGMARVTVGAGVKLVVSGDLDIEVDGSVNYDIGGNANFKVGGNLNFGVGGSVSIAAGGDLGIDAGMINLNSGTAENIGSSARSGSGSDYSPQLPENFLDSVTISIDDADGPTVDAANKKAIKEGTMTQAELDAGAATKPEVIDEKPPAEIESIAASCSAFSGKTDIPESTQLSRNFTLAMLSTRAAAGSHKVKPQHGLSEGQIVCNLKQVAENCLDKIKSQYPNMFVTSGFRIGSGSSQHERGQACDMQFTGVPKSGYYEISQWIKDNIAFDQLLLEYKTTGTGNPWIHISFTEKNRKMVLTLMNNATVGQGLRKMA